MLPDLISNIIITTQKNLVNVFDILIEHFQKTNQIKLLECIYIKNELTSIKMCTFLNTNQLEKQFQYINTKILPIFIKSEIVLNQINSNLNYFLQDENLNLDLILNEMLLIKITTNLNELLEILNVLIKNKNNININNKNLTFLSNLNNNLLNLTEVIRNNSPCFKEFLQQNNIKQDVKIEEINLIEFEKFQTSRKNNLKLNQRFIFVNDSKMTTNYEIKLEEIIVKTIPIVDNSIPVFNSIIDSLLKLNIDDVNLNNDLKFSQSSIKSDTEKLTIFKNHLLFLNSHETVTNLQELNKSFNDYLGYYLTIALDEFLTILTQLNLDNSNLTEIVKNLKKFKINFNVLLSKVNKNDFNVDDNLSQLNLLLTAIKNLINNE